MDAYPASTCGQFNMTTVRTKHPGEEGEIQFLLLPSPLRDYSAGEICALLEMAEDRGFSLEKGSSLEGLTISELDDLVHAKAPSE